VQSAAGLSDTSIEGETSCFEIGSFGCIESFALSPVLPEEEGHYAAARFQVDEPSSLCTVRYLLVGDLAGEIICENFVAHEALIFKGPSEAPPTEIPNDALRFDVAGADIRERGRIVSFDRPTNEPLLNLEAGDTFYVAIKMNAGVEGRPMCLSTCQDNSPQPRDSWWSNAAEPPFAWAQLADFGLDLRLKVVLDLRKPQSNGQPAICVGR